MDTRSDHPLEFRHIALLTFLGILLGIIPFIVAWAVTPKDMVFSGALVNPDDYRVYLSAIQQSRSGYWLSRYFFTPETYQPQLSYPVYFLLGKFAILFSGSNQLWFHFSRVAFGVFTFWAYLFLVRSLFPESRRIQSTAWTLISFGSGFGFIALTFNQIRNSQPADLYVPEWNTITNLIDSPHFILALGLLAVFYGALLRIERESDPWKWTLIAALAGLGIGLTYPYHIPSAGLVAGLWFLIIAIKQKKIPWTKWGQGAVILFPLSVLLVYYTVFIRQDPLWEQSQIQNQILPSPTPFEVFLGYGLLIIFAIPNLIKEGRDILKSKVLLPIIWILTGLAILYLPIPFAKRFALGLHIPIALLAAGYIENILLPNVTNPESVRRMIIWLTIPSTLLFVSLTSFLAVENNGFPYYYPGKDLAAVDWLSNHTTEDDLTLSSYPIGNYIPGIVNTTVFAGHWNITINRDEKLALLQKFWQPETTHTWREEFIQEWQVTYIFQGTYENALSGENLILPWEIIYEQDGVKIYITGLSGD